MRFKVIKVEVHVTVVYSCICMAACKEGPRITIAKPAQQFDYAMQILSHYHHLFLWKLIVFMVCKHKIFA